MPQDSCTYRTYLTYRACRKPRATRLLAVSVTAALAILATPMPAMAEPKPESRWLDSELHIDGFVADWHGLVTQFKKSDIDVGVANDGEFLYLSISSDQRAVRRQILTQGLTLWLDAGGNKAQVFGIRFPLGMKPNPRGDGSRRSTPRTVVNPRTAEGKALRQQREARRQRAEEALQHLEILSAGDEVVQRLAIDQAEGLEVAINMDRTSEKFGYELKIPLHANPDHPWAIGNLGGDTLGIGTLGIGTLGIGLISPKIERPARDGDRQGRGGPGVGNNGGGFSRQGGRGVGGPGGGRGGGGRRDGGGRGGGRGERALSPIELWTVYTLATADSAAQE